MSASTLGPITAVVCNYNGREHLPPCLSALRLSSRKLAELVVVDNASTDESVELLRRDFRDVRVVQLASNDGPCAARNRGLAEARSEWVLLVDNDAVLAPDALAKLEQAALARPDAVVIQPRSVVASQPGTVHYDGGSLHYCGLFALRNFFRPVAQAEGRGVVEVDGCVSVVLLVKRELLVEFGGFDPAYFILFEDLDLSFRLRAMGRAIVSVEEALCLHGGGTPDLSFRDGPRYPGSRVRHHSKNRWLHIANNYRARTILCCLPSFAAYEVAQFAFALAAGAAGEWWRGKREWWADRAHWRARRAGLERTRTTPDRRLLVGGPLTLTPAAARGGRALVARLLDGWMRAWWWILRPFAG